MMTSIRWGGAIAHSHHYHINNHEIKQWHNKRTKFQTLPLSRQFLLSSILVTTRGRYEPAMSEESDRMSLIFHLFSFSLSDFSPPIKKKGGVGPFKMILDFVSGLLLSFQGTPPFTGIAVMLMVIMVMYRLVLHISDAFMGDIHRLTSIVGFVLVWNCHLDQIV